MSFENFPYTNFHEMNMDWVIKIVKDFLAKYEYIEELIRTGKEDIINLTAEELQALTDKKEELEALLQEWYNSHSEDIALELARAITAFNTAADTKAERTLESIPADYTSLSDDVIDLKYAVKTYNSYPLSIDFFNRTDGVHNGITYTWRPDGSCVITGTATANSINNLYNNTSALPNGLEAGKSYFLKYKTSDPAIRFGLAYYKSDSTVSYFYYTEDSIITIPSNCVGMIIRLYVNSGTTFSAPAIVSVADIFSLDSPYVTNLSARGILQNGTDLNNVKGTNSIYLVGAGAEHDHTPVSQNVSGAVLLIYSPVPGVTVQQFIYLETNKLSYWSRKYIQTLDSWDNWTEISNSTALLAKGILPNGTDLNNVKGTNSIYLVGAGAEHDHTPVSQNVSGAVLLVYTPTPTITVQQFIYLTSNNMTYWARKYVQAVDSWDDWTEISNSKALLAKGILPNGTDLNNVKGTNSIYLVGAGAEHDHTPVSPNVSGAVLFVYTPTPTITVQQFIYLARNNMSYWARKYVQAVDSWDDWTEVSGSSVNITNNYTFPEFSNSYTLNATPTITTDTNNYLAATGDATDRTADIMAMLTATGVCHLGPGSFYVSGIDLPVYGELCGCGNKTSIILIEGNNYAVKMGTYSSVHDLRIVGRATQYTPTADTGSVHGILWQGNASEESSGVSGPYRGRISNVLISDFHGGGITCYNTGLAWSSSVIVENVQINRCDVGINIPYFSEFNRFVNIEAGDCYYGCVCNGGNNYFTNCCFSGNHVNLLMDDENGQSRNNSHGSFVACNFHHSRSDGGTINQGTTVKLIGLDNGEMFNACSFGYGAIEISNCKRMQFTGCQFLPGLTISVEDCVTSLFTGCTFLANQVITIIGSTATVFTGCYDSEGAIYNP